MSVESPFVRIRNVPAQERVRSFMITVSPGEPIRQVEKRISEQKFREPISIGFGIGIKPFWRRGEAPDLPNVESHDPFLKSHY